MPFFYLFVILFLSVTDLCAAKRNSTTSSYVPLVPVECALPRAEGGDLKNVLLVGHAGLGLGNYLISFPAAYSFSTIVGRKLQILAGSLIGTFCSFVKCGFPLNSNCFMKNERFYCAGEKVELKFLDSIEDIVKVKKDELPSLRAFNFLNYFAVEGGRFMQGKPPLNPAMHIFGYMHTTSWMMRLESMESAGRYNYSSRIYDCMERVSHCNDVKTHHLQCLDSHALQELVVGPFYQQNDGVLSSTQESKRRHLFLSKEYLEKNVHNLPPRIRHSLLNDKFIDTPRIDIAIHMRNMFHYFETPTNNSNHEDKEEVATWLTGGRGRAVFQAFEAKVSSLTSAYYWRRNRCYRPTVFVAADSPSVKRAMIAHLEKRLRPTSCNSSKSSSSSSSSTADNMSKAEKEEEDLDLGGSGGLKVIYIDDAIYHSMDTSGLSSHGSSR
jgi:hypothetical protein